jgi:4'-phosphopantetheinyl transferase
VHVWRAGLDVEALRHFEETLSPDEQARAERFHASVDRAHYLAARGTLRAILAQYLGTPAAALRFCANAQGKPALLPSGGIEDLRFNVSHSHGLALFAFALRREVGVDLEEVRPSGKENKLAERFFSPQEVAALRALPASSQAEAFFHCWTRKEAYVKARGTGLSIDLSSFAVSLAPGELINLPVSSASDPEAARWSIRALSPGSGYAGAVAAEGADWAPRLWQWDE